MKRVFKFRNWSLSEKRWLSVSPDVPFQNIMGNCVSQQWTGFLDENEREIYEGDIIVLDGSTYPYKYEIVWDTWKWGIDSKGIVFDGIQGMTSAIYKRAIIIGNIFETPELLK